jgi:glycosyltransferase involved in cell wall biosynthesis
LRTLVSVVINNHNYNSFLPQAIDSALAQTHDRVEVVVVDDGSNDGSLKTIDGYGSRIVAVVKENGGQASALNAGFAACRGDIVIFLDSDDELYPTAATDMAAALTSAAAAKAHGVLDEVDADGHFLGRTNPANASALAEGDVLPALLASGRYVCPVMSGNAFPRWLLQRIMPIPESAFASGADGYLVALSGLHGPIVATKRPVGKYRRHGANVWAAEPTADSLSRQLRRELSKYEELKREANKLGLPLADGFEFNDYPGLRTRIASLRLTGTAHPVQGDTRFLLARSGVFALWRTAHVDVRRRLMFTVWFVIVAFGPLPLARRAITWLYVATARPAVWRLHRQRVKQMEQR